MTDARRLEYHQAVHRAARAFFFADGREDLVAAVVARRHLCRAVHAAGASGAYPMPRRLLPSAAASRPPGKASGGGDRCRGSVYVTLLWSMPMNDRTAIVITVVGSAAGTTVVLAIAMICLIGALNTRISDVQASIDARFDDAIRSIAGPVGPPEPAR